MEAHKATYSQLWDAAQQGRADEVREILRSSLLHGGLKQVCLELALSVACRNNWPCAAQALLDAKARPDAWAHPGRHPSPLFVAADNGHVEVLRLLVLAKAGVNQDCCTAYNPLQVASAVGQTDVVRYLLSLKACPRLASGYGYTPVELATLHGHPAVLRVLVSAHADPANI
jgi:ankyrin repeat protein